MVKSSIKMKKAELNIKGYDHFYKEEKPEDKIVKRRGVIIYTKESLNAQYFDNVEGVCGHIDYENDRNACTEN